MQCKPRGAWPTSSADTVRRPKRTVGRYRCSSYRLAKTLAGNFRSKAPWPIYTCRHSVVGGASNCTSLLLVSLYTIPPSAMFVSISVGAAADAETDVDVAGGAEFCDAAAAVPWPAGVTLAGTADAPGAEPAPAAFVPATVEDAIRLFVGGTVVVLAPEIICCGGQEVLVLLLALELPLMPEEGGGAWDGEGHDSGEDSDDDEDEDDILLLLELLAAAAAAATW